MTMARKSRKNGFDTSALEKYAEKLEKLGGSDALKRATEAGMHQAKAAINKQVTAAMQHPNLPAGGKYATDETLESLDRSSPVTWEGNVGSIPVGFDMSKSGITSILLMHGTPTMPPVPGLHDALYGKKGKAAARKAQEEAMQKVIERLGG